MGAPPQEVIVGHDGTVWVQWGRNEPFVGLDDQGEISRRFALPDGAEYREREGWDDDPDHECNGDCHPAERMRDAIEDALSALRGVE